jgi:hypothetical protein
MSSGDFGAFDAILNTPQESTQQANQGTLKGADGVTTPSQPEAGMDEQGVSSVVLFEVVDGVCGSCLAKGEEHVRFCSKDIVDAVASTCGPTLET